VSGFTLQKIVYDPRENCLTRKTIDVAPMPSAPATIVAGSSVKHLPESQTRNSTEKFPISLNKIRIWNFLFAHRVKPLEGLWLRRKAPSGFGGSMIDTNGLFKVLLYKEDDDAMSCVLALRHEGEIWLVPEWIRSADSHAAKPLRIFSLAKFLHRPLRGGSQGDFLISGFVPKALFEKRLPETIATAFDVRDFPDLCVRTRVFIGPFDTGTMHG
jgi:hypothetical protein